MDEFVDPTNRFRYVVDFQNELITRLSTGASARFYPEDLAWMLKKGWLTPVEETENT